MAPLTLFPLSGRRVFVAGHRGMVGSALMHRLGQEECQTLTADRKALDLRNQGAVDLDGNDGISGLHRQRPISFSGAQYLDGERQAWWGRLDPPLQSVSNWRVFSEG